MFIERVWVQTREADQSRLFTKKVERLLIRREESLDCLLTFVHKLVPTNKQYFPSLEPIQSSGEEVDFREGLKKRGIL